MSDGPLAGETAVVTGASSGIGAATTRALARDGADVVLAARREERLQEIAADVSEEYGVRNEVVPTDVTDEDAVAALVDATVEQFGGLDLLVNNAGLAAGSDVAEMTTDEYRSMMDVNVDGTFFTTRAALPHLVDSEGTLVFLGSFAGKFPRPFNPVYAATKWWVRGFALSVAGQVGDENLAVSVINPSEVRTEFEVEGSSFAEMFEEGSVTEADEVAEGVAFAARQDNSTVAELDLYRRDKFTGF
jgi:NADP-dependent 3-hydroxy acid dehydrogenase YdfG